MIHRDAPFFVSIQTSIEPALPAVLAGLRSNASDWAIGGIVEDTHLKKQIFLWRFFLLLLVFCSLILVQGRAQSRNAQKQSPQAADAKEKNVKEYVELLRTDVRQQKAQILGAVMQFDVDQAAKFWPIYNDYDAELTKLKEYFASTLVVLSVGMAGSDRAHRGIG